MAWLRTDDQAPDHPKVLRAQTSVRAKDLTMCPELLACAVFGFVSLCSAWSAGKLQDGWIPESLARRCAGADWQVIAKAAIKADMFSPRQRGPLGEYGWYVNQDDELLHMRTKDEVHADRDKSRATRQSGPTREVRLRDGDQCRYCGKSVNWTDRVSARGGTYDHPDPKDRDTFVVACFGCNRHHSSNPEQKRPPLLPVPDVPLIGPDTAQRFSVAQTAPERVTHDAAPSESASAPGQPAAAAQGRPDLHLDLPSEVVQTYPRRDGPGQVGTAAQPVRAGPRRTRRGSRAGKTKPPPDQPDQRT